jgi:AmmeMemoRadiSam system protein B/AmmeMemoRadiSam system protein A
MAGHWFPASPPALQKLVNESWEAAARRSGVSSPRRGLAALIVPHAGLKYSGVVAAGAYRLIDRPRTAIVLAFSHRAAMEGVAAAKVTSYETPAGTVRVDAEAVRALGFPTMEESRLCDHSIENQLPFLSRALPGVPIVPLYVGHLTPARLAAAAKKLAIRVRAGDLLIASSDFTHYGKAYGYTPFPADSRLPTRLRERAEEAFETIGSLDVPAFDQYLQTTGDTICGRDPIRLLMATLAQSHGDKVYMTTADYDTSTSVADGDPSLNVGYGALAFYPAASFTVNSEGQRTLLSHSRLALDSLVRKQTSRALLMMPDGFDQRTGAFVTIRKGKELRGCIGTLSPRAGLLETIADRTRAAAVADPRFPPLSASDLPVSLEVSLLTPIRRLQKWQAWRPGQGALITLGSSGGLLLPQVATEMGWNREQFLEGLAQKAGLAPDAYRDKRAKLYVFEAQVFGE